MNTASLFQEPPIVLVVDDDQMTRQLLRRAMEQQDYQVVEASNGEECLKAYQDYQPHIVLIDALMPVMDGFTCCTYLQKLPGGDRTPILMITSLDDKESVDRAFAVGATEYVTKPIHWPVLLQRVRRLIHQFLLVEQLEAANLELQRLANSDGLTQVANRRRFDEYFDEEWRRHSRTFLPLSLILCDIDFFKRYNDTYGHQAGDECLKLVANTLSNNVKRVGDLVARYGGEEFVVLLPNTLAENAFEVAEKIRENLKQLHIPHAGSKVSEYVTLSLGVASTYPHQEQSKELLLASADKALYQAKTSGRDRTILNVVGEW
ncbi:response regulator receiver modulated diguanylate cyclase [Crinalium epipsammum PCC 9333]|uniref:Response regulator receiver modulated diguanylate cyclase n=1 Tax=Crinalium epipsammum PCC 9333 TaxID=1173022 RepID=K9VY93_9CYAN|nr:PleD family two-component system response regulator [Crinalium epipsammum]AFZ13078.1 response regulator receiver modulated diguanylate cyclase [Crinalium epipsammum PCC 9333]